MKIADIAISALSVHQKRVETSANNIANHMTTGSDETVFRPSRTVSIARNDGSVVARTRLLSPGTVSVFSPDHELADADGLIQAPNVSLATELMEIKTATASYKASLKLLHTAEEMASGLLEAGKNKNTR